MTFKNKISILNRMRDGEQSININKSRKILIEFAILYAVSLFVLLFLTNSYFIIAAFGPLYVLWISTFLLWYIKVWKSFGYKIIWLIALIASVITTSVTLHKLVF